MTNNVARTRLAADELERASALLAEVAQAFSSRVVGQEQLRESLLAALLARGHVLVESVPGLAKTLAASTLANEVSGSFNRIQCTPDLLPSDILGTQVFDPSTTSFRTDLGPVHANFVLLDEINRSSAKTQSAMLEAMQERQTSIGGQTFPLPRPFMVLATQNPIEEEGTYVLPQAQMDRFLLKTTITYPDPDEELRILDRIQTGEIDEPVASVMTTDQVLELQDLTDRVFVHPDLKAYIVQLVNATREPSVHLDGELASAIDYGASPRCSIAFLKVSRALALIAGRSHVVPGDVTKLAHEIMRHRIVLTFEAQASGITPDQVVDAILKAVPTP